VTAVNKLVVVAIQLSTLQRRVLYQLDHTQTDSQADRQAHRQTDRLTGRQTGTQIRYRGNSKHTQEQMFTASLPQCCGYVMPSASVILPTVMKIGR